MSQKVMLTSRISRRTVVSGRRAALVPAAGRVRSRAELSLALVLSLTITPLSAVRTAHAASTQPDAAPSGEGKAAALPRQFSVEVGVGGGLFADGTRLGATSELERWAQRALAASRFVGAVVFGDEERDGAAITEAVEVLRRAGFPEVRRVGRPAPAELSAARSPSLAPVVSAGKTAAPSPSPSPSPSPVPSPSPSPSVPSASPARAPAVVLATVGLHVDGLLDKEPHRSRLVRVFEHEFGAFRRCHERAERHEQGASFGVDLLIPKTGGRAKVRQTRTRLESKPFRACMQSAFEAIRFSPPPSARAEIVSYSVLFKPGGQ